MSDTSQKSTRIEEPARGRTDPAALAAQQAQNVNRPADPPRSELEARAMAKAENDAGPTTQRAGTSDKSTATTRAKRATKAVSKSKTSTRRAAANDDAAAEEAPRRVDRFQARRDAAETARKATAKATGGNLFPEKAPQEGQIVLATKAGRLGSPTFLAQYRKGLTDGPDGAFYSNRNGAYSMFEGTVDSWMEAPGL